MVARTPPRRTAKVAPLPLNPLMLRETVKKVDRCMARLQELQYVVTGGNKAVSGISLSPKSTRSYLKTSLRSKQESFRNGNGGVRTLSPTGKFEGGWKRMSLPAMLVGETVGEIIQASQFAREIVKSVSYITQAGVEDPKTPNTTKQRRHNRPQAIEHTQLKSRRKREKQNASQSFRSDQSSPKLQRAKSGINFKVSPPKRNDTAIEKEKESGRHSADRISPRHKPWAKKTVLFPNPLFTSTSPTRQLPQRFSRTRSPIIARNKQLTPHKFLIKSPASASKSKLQVKIKKSPPRTNSPTKTYTKKSPPRKRTSPSPTRTGIATSCTKNSPKTSTSRSKSPARLACGIKTLSPPPRLGVTIGKKSPKMSTASKLRRSLSPARLASRLMSPLKSRKPVRMSIEDGLMTMPASKRRSITPMRFLIPRI